MSMVQQAVEIGAPLHAVYEQLAAFENYPQFMTGVQRVTQTGTDQTHWIMDVEGHHREFDAQITECSLDQRVAWATTEGPLLAETMTLRPMGEARTQLVAQLEADVAFLLPSDRHGQQTLSRRLKADLDTFKGLIEAGKLGADLHMQGASTKRLAGNLASPASVAARARGGRPGAGWGRSGGEQSNLNTGTEVDITSAPGITSAADLEDVLPPGRRIVGARTVTGGAAPMGSKAMGPRDLSRDGAVNEEERSSDLDR